MKPPPRPRLVPARFAEAPAGRPRAAAWSLREKRSLLAALRAQAALGLPELQARPLRESLPRRSEAEVWLELAQMLAEGVEEAAAAFSQGLSCWGHGWIWGPTAAVPAPTLWVLQGQKEYFFGDAVTLVCTTPPSITGKLTYQIFGEAGWAVSGFSSTNNYTFEFVLSRMQHRGPHFCSYSLKQGRKQLISPTSEKLVIKIGDHLPQPLLMVESPLGEGWPRGPPYDRRL